VRNLGREDIKIKSVGFDTSIPLHTRLLDIANEQKNFSEYVRTLMIADMLTNGAISNLSIIRQKKNNVIPKEFSIDESEKKKKYEPKDFELEL